MPSLLDVGAAAGGITGGLMTLEDVRSRRRDQDIRERLATAEIEQSRRLGQFTDQKLTLLKAASKQENVEFQAKQDQQIQKGKILEQLQTVDADLDLVEKYGALAKIAAEMNEKDDPLLKSRYIDLFSEVNAALSPRGMQLTAQGSFDPIPVDVDPETGEPTRYLSIADMKKMQHDAAGSRELLLNQLAILDHQAAQEIRLRRQGGKEALTPFQPTVVAKGMLAVTDTRTGQVTQHMFDLSEQQKLAQNKPIIRVIDDEVYEIYHDPASGAVMRREVKDATVDVAESDAEDVETPSDGGPSLLQRLMLPADEGPKIMQPAPGKMTLEDRLNGLGELLRERQ